MCILPGRRQTRIPPSFVAKMKPLGQLTLWKGANAIRAPPSPRVGNARTRPLRTINQIGFKPETKTPAIPLPSPMFSILVKREPPWTETSLFVSSLPAVSISIGTRAKRSSFDEGDLNAWYAKTEPSARKHVKSGRSYAALAKASSRMSETVYFSTSHSSLKSMLSMPVEFGASISRPSETPPEDQSFFKDGRLYKARVPSLEMVAKTTLLFSLLSSFSSLSPQAVRSSQPGALFKPPPPPPKESVQATESSYNVNAVTSLPVFE
mmetsp:Transcript_6297/g.19755  ORF Transcript_6297/g.19755 Transcript_6297/m.19755 type:complete len:265 (+) Transcript_6297:1349-2143(+)